MLHNYYLNEPHIFISEEQKNEKGEVIRKAEPYIKGILENMSNSWAKQSVQPVFMSMNAKLINKLRKLLPSTGQWVDVDGNKHDWNGLRQLQAEEVFGEAEYQAVIDSLEKDLILPGGKYINTSLGGKYAMKYSQNLGTHVAGDWVCEPNSNFIKVYETVNVFVLVEQENPDPDKPDQYVRGWSPDEVIKARRALYYPIESITTDQLKGCRFKTDAQGAAIVTVEDDEDPGI